MEGPDLAGVRRLAELLREKKRVVVFTGAGMSTESGLPDFRSAGGLWKQNRRFEELASVTALEQDYDEFVEFYRYRLRALAKFRPHAGHEVLARWQGSGLLQTLITQNVDGFHEQAGSSDVLCLHGTLSSAHCHACRIPTSREVFLERTPPECTRCGGRLRPSVVLFGEALDAHVLARAARASEWADLFLVLGSSLLVSPANQLPRLAVERGDASLVIVNREPTPLCELAALTIRSPIGATLAAADRELSGVGP
jgi:NAD-dependent deacetylase